MEKERRVKALAIVVLVIAVLGLTIAFAALSQTLTINGNARINASTWDVHFENMNLSNEIGKGKNLSYGIDNSDNTKATLSVNLKQPKDSVVYTIDVVNNGDINAKITSIKLTDTSNIPYLDFTAVYANNESIETEQVLEKNDSIGVILTVTYKDVNKEDLVTESKTIDLEVELVYEQTDSEKNSGENNNQEYGTEVTSWNISASDSDNITMTYYDPVISKSTSSKVVAMSNELAENEVHEGGTIVISGTGATSDDFAILLALADKTSIDEIQISDEGIIGLKYNPTSVIVESGVTRLGDSSFMLTSVENVTLPNSLTEIGDYAFENCTKLKTINLPSELVLIGYAAFRNCSSLTNTITINENERIRDEAFSGSGVTKVIINKTYSSSNEYNSIFSNCKNLTEVVVNKKTLILNKMFMGCTSLNTISGTGSIEGVGSQAFEETALTSIRLGAANIGEKAFYNCKNLKKIYIYHVRSMSANAFYGIASNSTLYYSIGLPQVIVKGIDETLTTMVEDPSQFE